MELEAVSQVVVQLFVNPVLPVVDRSLSKAGWTGHSVRLGGQVTQ